MLRGIACTSIDADLGNLTHSVLYSVLLGVTVAGLVDVAFLHRSISE